MPGDSEIGGHASEEDTVIRGAVADASAHTAQQQSPQTQPLVLPQTPARIRVAVSAGEVLEFDLTAPVLLGREPQSPRITPAVAPRLVSIASPTGEISATHLSLEPSGSLVVITDLHSTNGTLVRLPGAMARRLRGGESLVAGDGALIELGDGAEIAVTAGSAPARGEV